MTNPLRGEAPLGDRVLCFDINALCVVEAETGKTLPVLIAELGAGAGMTTLRALVWAGLQKHAPCTIDDAGNIMSDAGLEASLQAVKLAMEAALPQAGGGSGPRKAKPAG